MNTTFPTLNFPQFSFTSPELLFMSPYQVRGVQPMDTGPHWMKYQRLDEHFPVVDTSTRASSSSNMQWSQEQIDRLYAPHNSSPAQSSPLNSGTGFDSLGLDTIPFQYDFTPGPSTYEPVYNEYRNDGLGLIQEPRDQMMLFNVGEYTPMQGSSLNINDINTPPYPLLPPTPPALPSLDMDSLLPLLPDIPNPSRSVSPQAPSRPPTAQIESPSPPRTRSRRRKNLDITEAEDSAPRRVRSNPTPRRAIRAKKVRRRRDDSDQSGISDDRRRFFSTCHVYGCTHISGTPHEANRHRDIHFDLKRHECPGCKKAYGRSSTLARHLKKERPRRCVQAAGPESTWGKDTMKFQTCPPAWFELGGVPQEIVNHWKPRWIAERAAFL
ncbi:hypothetical protein AX16_007521 [Volvariella volvacea WC 439]|nr:hypothetical protein AX16_007521 [Volvariella volvacea WC 439]